MEREGAYSIRDEAGSLDTRGLDSLEEVDHTLCLESFQLRVETDECPCPPHSITEGKCGKEGGMCRKKGIGEMREYDF